MISQMQFFPVMGGDDIQLYIERDKSVDTWIAEHHYLHCVPAGAVIRMCFKDREQKLLGCMMWGRPTSRKIDQERILELTRMCFIEDTQHCIESRALAMARKYIRKHYPRIKGVIAYSSTGQGHEGGIYQADGWFELGSGSIGGSWESREKRTNRDLSRKLRWVRTP